LCCCFTSSYQAKGRFRVEIQSEASFQISDQSQLDSPRIEAIGPSIDGNSTLPALKLDWTPGAGLLYFLKEAPLYCPFLFLNNKGSSYLLSQPWTCPLASKTSFICCHVFSTKMLISSSVFVLSRCAASSFFSNLLFVYSQFVPAGMAAVIILSGGRCSFHIHHQNFKKSRSIGVVVLGYH
jgi:hypothetical protein